MSKATATITRTANPAGWYWTFDRADIADGVVDNFATAANPNAAIDAIKPLIQAMPGSLSKIVLHVDSFEAP